MSAESRKGLVFPVLVYDDLCGALKCEHYSEPKLVDGKNFYTVAKCVIASKTYRNIIEPADNCDHKDKFAEYKTMFYLRGEKYE